MKARLKEIGEDPNYTDELEVLRAYAVLLEQQADTKAKRKAAQEDLDKKLDAKYPKLTEAEVKALVVEDKWMARLSADVQGELDRVSQTLTGRIRQLAERYACSVRGTGRAGRPRGWSLADDGLCLDLKDFCYRPRMQYGKEGLPMQLVINIPDSLPSQRIEEIITNIEQKLKQESPLIGVERVAPRKVYAHRIPVDKIEVLDRESLHER